MEKGTDQSRDPGCLYDLTEEEAYLQTDEEEKPAIIAEPLPDLASLICSFCRKPREHLFGSEYPVRDPNTFAIIARVWICNECVARFAGTLAQHTDG